MFRYITGRTLFPIASALTLAVGIGAPAAAHAQSTAGVGFDPAAVTFHKDIEPILQRSCQNCHREESVAPMSLLTYEQTRPWARSMKRRTGMGRRAGVMPPWYVEQNIGIQEYKFDPSLSDTEVAMMAAWADNGAPRGNLEDAPPPRDFGDGGWTIGEPDLITVLPEVIIGGDQPDWWGEIETTPVGNTRDRYVEALEFREINDVLDTEDSRETVGGRFVFHHMIWSTQVIGDDGAQDETRSEPTTTGWPVHEVGRNADTFDPEAGRLLAANSSVVSNSVHLHSNGRDTRSHLEIAWRFHPDGYKPKLKRASRSLGDGLNIDIRPEETDQELHAYTVLQTHQKLTTFEPHLHAPGQRMCLEAIWGNHIETLTCAGYDHNWVRTYEYADHTAPILPKGTILHIIGYMDNTIANRNVPDPRNWQGSGNRSVTNMFIDLGIGVQLSDEQFLEQMEERRQAIEWRLGDHVIGCPLCPYDDLTIADVSDDDEADDDGESETGETAETAAQQQ
ncbi:MAG: hypothetical protein VYE68_10020 [Acidobacteriota bacterium]|nr:hypothetical protein [Acidobacteriota bacterium]